MNQTQRLERLADLDRTAAAFRAAGQAEQKAEALRSSLVEEARQAEVERIAAQTRQRGEAAVVEAKPALLSWRSRFQQWVSDGHQLAQELSGIETPLFLAVRNLVGGVRQAKGQAHNIEEAGLLAGVAERESLDALREIGALDVALSPWPEGGNEWARGLIEAMAAQVGTRAAVFDPRGGVKQFLDRRTHGAY